jgi:hypothetical protein
MANIGEQKQKVTIRDFLNNLKTQLDRIREERAEARAEAAQNQKIILEEILLQTDKITVQTEKISCLDVRLARIEVLVEAHGRNLVEHSVFIHEHEIKTSHANGVQNGADKAGNDKKAMKEIRVKWGVAVIAFAATVIASTGASKVIDKVLTAPKPTEVQVIGGNQ